MRRCLPLLSVFFALLGPSCSKLTPGISSDRREAVTLCRLLQHENESYKQKIAQIETPLIAALENELSPFTMMTGDQWHVRTQAWIFKGQDVQNLYGTVIQKLVNLPPPKSPAVQIAHSRVLSELQQRIDYFGLLCNRLAALDTFFRTHVVVNGGSPEMSATQQWVAQYRAPSDLMGTVLNELRIKYEITDEQLTKL